MSSTAIKDDTHDAEALSISINKKESISDRNSPHRMEILIKRLDKDEIPLSSMSVKKKTAPTPVPKRSKAGEDGAPKVYCMIIYTMLLVVPVRAI